MIAMEEVQYIEGLAKLKLSEEERQRFTRDFSGILEHVKQLSQVDTNSVPPTVSVLTLENVFREDEIQPSMDRDKILENAGDSHNGCFRVPRII
jgi:aspartyl-tRNA(Asn)/glutamyl-tRNA(Gln) amidotransferase subunit C